MFGLYISNVNNGELVLSFFLTHGCCVTAFVSLCDCLHIPIAELKHLAHKQNKYPYASFSLKHPFALFVLARVGLSPTGKSSFVYVYASFVAVSNRFSRSLDHCFRSFRSLFESISIDYKTLQQWS